MVVAIIPARYGSSRLPGKPLALIQEKPMVQWVYENARKAAKIDRVVVATDDERILQCVEGFGGEAVLTSATHPSGTDRCHEAATKLRVSAHHILNIQGDEPFIDPSVLDQLASLIQLEGTQIATLATPISDRLALTNPNVVKVVADTNGQALYFSRHPIPFQRSQPIEKWLENGNYYRHYGLYAYRSDVLGELATLPPSSLEIAESLEQLRWLENGYRIKVGITATDSLAIDTAEDLAKANHLPNQH